MGKYTFDRVKEILTEKYADDIITADSPYNFPTLNLKRENIHEIIRFLHDNEELKFRFLTTLCGLHYPDQKLIAVMYQLHSLENNFRLRLRIYLPEENPVTPTITDIFSAANWMERETYDFFGVTFTGHPDLRRILNVEDMIVFPLRKEIPLEDQTREDKKDFMFGR